MEDIKNALKVVWKVVQLGMFCWAITQVFAVRNLWLETVPESADVLTVQAKGFWGPVHVLVPRHCKHFEKNDADIEDSKKESGDKREDDDTKEKSHMEGSKSRRLAPPGPLRGSAPVAGAEVQPPFEKASEWAAPLRGAGAAASWPRFASGGQAGPPVDATADEEAIGRHLHESDDSEDVTYNATHITVKRCGKTLYFEQPTDGQRYWAMLFLSGQDTMEELRASRCRMLWLLVVAAVIENLKGCLPSNPESQGYEAVLKGSPAPVRAVCGLVTDTYQKFATLQSQLAIMSLFFVYWHNHAYMVSFIPGTAYICLFFTYFIFYAWQYVQDCQDCGAHAKLYCTVSSYCWLLFVIPYVLVPMVFGYGFYSGNFLWNTALADAVSADLAYGMVDLKTEGDYLEKEKVMEAAWAGDMECVRSAAEWLFGVHASEVALNFVLTLAECLIPS